MGKYEFALCVVSILGSLTISAYSVYFSFRKVSKSLRQLKTAVTKISIYSNFAEIVKEPFFNYLSNKFDGTEILQIQRQASEQITSVCSKLLRTS